MGFSSALGLALEPWISLLAGGESIALRTASGAGFPSARAGGQARTCGYEGQLYGSAPTEQLFKLRKSVARGPWPVANTAQYVPRATDQGQRTRPAIVAIGKSCASGKLSPSISFDRIGEVFTLEDDASHRSRADSSLLR